MSLTGEDWRRIAEGQERLVAASSLPELVDSVHEGCAALADYDVSCVTIWTADITRETIGASRIVAKTGAISARDVQAYDRYYNRTWAPEICTDDRGAPPAVLVECAHGKHEFINDYIIPMGIRRYYGSLLSLGPRRGFLAVEYNCAGASARSLLPARERLTAIKPFIERLLALHGHLDAPRRTASVVAEGRRLSPREEQVADLLSRRLTAQEIATRLGISRRTVENHALHLYQKLGICGRAELISLFHG